MLTKILLISHGETDAFRKVAFPDDNPLNDAAIAEIQGTKAPDMRGAVLSRGNNLACAQTAVRLFGQEAAPVSLIDEINYGAWAGKTLRDLSEDDENALMYWISDPAFAPPGGTSRQELYNRVINWLDEASKRKQRIIAVVSPSVIRAAIIYVLGAPPEAFWNIDIVPLSMTDLRHDGRRWALRTSGVSLARKE